MVPECASETATNRHYRAGARYTPNQRAGDVTKPDVNDLYTHAVNKVHLTRLSQTKSPPTHDERW